MKYTVEYLVYYGYGSGRTICQIDILVHAEHGKPTEEDALMFFREEIEKLGKTFLACIDYTMNQQTHTWNKPGKPRLVSLDHVTSLSVDSIALNESK